jgi:hypothetical protein
MLVMVGLLTVPFWLFFPQWLPDFIVAIRTNPRWLQPSLFSYFSVTENMVTFALWLFYAMAMFLLVVWLWYKQPLFTALFWSLALTTLVTPYIWSWDYTLLIPLLVQTACTVKSLLAKLIFGAGFSLGAGYALYNFFYVTTADHTNWWLPFAFCGIVMIAKLVDFNKSQSVIRAND